MFFDLRKAFDSVPHKTLIDKFEQTGVNSHVLRWITDYLTNREQNVVVNGECSSSKTVLSGVPQGSVLRPLLFLIYVDDLAFLLLTDGSQCVLYAGDLLLFRPVKDQVDIQPLQNDVTSVEEWTQCNHLTLNTSKCKSMIVLRKRSQSYSSVYIDS